MFFQFLIFKVLVRSSTVGKCACNLREIFSPEILTEIISTRYDDRERSRPIDGPYFVFLFLFFFVLFTVRW